MMSMMIIITAIDDARPVLPIVIMIGITIKSRCRPAPLAFAENGGRVDTR